MPAVPSTELWSPTLQGQRPVAGVAVLSKPSCQQRCASRLRGIERCHPPLPSTVSPSGTTCSIRLQPRSPLRSRVLRQPVSPMPTSERPFAASHLPRSWSSPAIPQTSQWCARPPQSRSWTSDRSGDRRCRSATSCRSRRISSRRYSLVCPHSADWRLKPPLGRAESPEEMAAVEEVRTTRLTKLGSSQRRLRAPSAARRDISIH
jgi:hypothetical protein